MANHTPTIPLLLLTNYLSVFDHFMELALKRLTISFCLLQLTFNNLVLGGKIIFEILIVLIMVEIARHQIQLFFIDFSTLQQL